MLLPCVCGTRLPWILLNHLAAGKRFVNALIRPFIKADFDGALKYPNLRAPIIVALFQKKKNIEMPGFTLETNT
jgi:hypothetical protein